MSVKNKYYHQTTPEFKKLFRTRVKEGDRYSSMKELFEEAESKKDIIHLHQLITMGIKWSETLEGFQFWHDMFYATYRNPKHLKYWSQPNEIV